MYPSRRGTVGNDRIRRISRDFRKQDSEIGSELRFRLISGKFRYPNLINASVCRFRSGSGLRFRFAVPVSPNDDRIQAQFPSDPVQILKPGSGRFRAVPPVSTTPQIPASRTNLRVPS